MASLMGVLSILDEVGIDAAAIDRAIAETAEVKVGVMDKAEEVKAYWQSIAPVGPYAHKLKSGYLDEPGDYRDSIRVKYHQKSSGFFSAQVGTEDFKAHWLEYGSIHNFAPDIGYAQKVVDNFGGTSIQNDDLGPGRSNNVSA